MYSSSLGLFMCSSPPCCGIQMLVFSSRRRMFYRSSPPFNYPSHPQHHQNDSTLIRASQAGHTLPATTSLPIKNTAAEVDVVVGMIDGLGRSPADGHNHGLGDPVRALLKLYLV